MLLSQAHRTICVEDMAALQGFRLSELTGATGAVSEAQLGGMLGNSMSVPVLCQAVKSALLASGLIVEK